MRWPGRLLFIRHGHLSPAGPAGEAIGSGGQELTVVPEERTRRLMTALLASGGSA